MKFRKSLYFILFLHSFFSFCQESYKIDTILLSNLRSNIPIMSSINLLMTSVGNTPCSIDFNNHRYIYIHSGKYDTTYCFNQITCFSKGISYLEKRGQVRLLNADFKTNSNIFISTDKIFLSKDLTMEDVKKAYHYSDDDFAGPQLGIMHPYYPQKKSDRFYSIRFSTGEHDNTYITLYFDKKKKLRLLSIDPYDF